MVNEELELFIHGQGAKPKVVVAKSAEVLRDVLLRLEIIKQGQDDILTFVGECEEALNEPDETEDGKDEHRPVDVALTIEVLELKRHRHVHIHKCRHVAVEVNFNGKTKRRRFSPATTIGVVTQWARRKFHLDPAAAAEYVLQLCNSTKQPRSTEHLGELVEPPKCSICFDLVKEITPQG
jgi:hypothetical protein